MAKFRGLLFLVFALVAGNVVFGDSFSSTTVGMPRWRRPTENGNNPPYQLSVVGNYCPYTVTPFNVSTAGTYRILTNGTEPSGWYIYTFLYGSSFDPTNQLVNVMVGNAAQPEEGISVLTVDLLADAQYILIVTGLRDYDEGAYTVSISDMSAPPLIEEPLAPATATATPTPTRTPTRVVSCSSNAQCGSLKACCGSKCYEYTANSTSSNPKCCTGSSFTFACNGISNCCGNTCCPNNMFCGGSSTCTGGCGSTGGCSFRARGLSSTLPLSLSHSSPSLHATALSRWCCACDQTFCGNGLCCKRGQKCSNGLCILA
mmetsp:Transcript_41530/g.67408  ORF Transcript_41530/g.67408 Transcript_41530/m.67408 type:complete len:316 (+) Transcript_41530:164-1111(+)